MGRARNTAGILASAAIAVSCATEFHGTTWEEDRRDGVHVDGTQAHVPPIYHPAPARSKAPTPALIDPASTATLEIALLEFPTHRRALENKLRSQQGKQWPETLRIFWVSHLSMLTRRLDEQPLPMRLLLQARVGTDVQIDETRKLFGPAPKDVEQGVRRVQWLVAKHVRAARKQSRPPPIDPHIPGFSWPVEPVVVTSSFGYRTDPILSGTRVRFHAGVDLYGDSGDVVLAAAAGRVERAGWWGGHGKTVIIQHPGGYRTIYAHLDRIMVKSGQLADSMTVVGFVGSSGRSTGPHLHFEVRRGGTPIDPQAVVGIRLANVSKNLGKP